MGEAVKAAAVPVKQNEGYFAADIIYEGSSVADEVLPKKIPMLLKICIQKQVLILN